MARQKQSLLQRILRIEPGVVLGQWIVDRITNNWTLLVALVGGGGMTYLAWLSDFLKSYGPVSWGAVGLVTLLTIAAIVFLFAHAKSKLANARYITAVSEAPKSTNPLKSIFEYERIKITDFYSHFAILNKNKSFRECEIHGPGAIVLFNHSYMYAPEVYSCDFVLVKEENISLYTVAAFETSTFRQCKFFNVLFMFTLDQAIAFQAECERYGVAMPRIVGYEQQHSNAGSSNNRPSDESSDTQSQ